MTEKRSNSKIKFVIRCFEIALKSIFILKISIVMLFNLEVNSNIKSNVRLPIKHYNLLIYALLISSHKPISDNSFISFCMYRKLNPCGSDLSYAKSVSCADVKFRFCMLRW